MTSTWWDTTCGPVCDVWPTTNLGGLGGFGSLGGLGGLGGGGRLGNTGGGLGTFGDFTNWPSLLDTSLSPLGWGLGSRDIRPIERQLPRHVGSRILYTTDTGEIVWRPAADVFEMDNDIIVHVDLPGVPKDDVKIDCREGELEIHGETKRVEGYEAATSRVRERNIGKFRKLVRLPPGVDYGNIQAKCENGLLEVKVPKGPNYPGIKRIALT